MRTDVARDMSTSARQFADVVFPAIQEWFGGGEIVPVESVTSSGFKRTLDLLSGIDAWQVVPKQYMRSIASRIQLILPGQNPYNTFTIRYTRSSGAETEYAKRMRAIEQHDRGWLYPHITIQAYVRKATEELLSVAAVKTTDLFDVASRQVADGRARIKTNPYDGNTFLVVTWANILGANKRLMSWPHDAGSKAA